MHEFLFALNKSESNGWCFRLVVTILTNRKFDLERKEEVCVGSITQRDFTTRKTHLILPHCACHESPVYIRPGNCSAVLKCRVSHIHLDFTRNC